MLDFFEGPQAHPGVAESGWCNCRGVVSSSNVPLQALICASFVLSDLCALGTVFKGRIPARYSELDHSQWFSNSPDNEQLRTAWV